MSTKFIFVTGGVVSGLGKGVTAGVLGRLLKARGLKVRNQKFDPYINVDPSLMSPMQHGEIFITADGAETDLDIGHYERFTDEELSVESDITSGIIYRDVIMRERAGGYFGGTVQVVPHIINEIKDHVFKVAREGDPDIVISEIGGTIGDMESQPFIEAIRQVSYQVGRENCLFIHVTLLPYLTKSREIKTKPTQHSVQKLLSYGIQPDILVCRTEVPIDRDIRKKLALYCNVREDSVIQNIDCDTIYELPLIFEKEGLSDVVCRRLGLAEQVAPDLEEWRQLMQRFNQPRGSLTIGLVGKYVSLHDAYYSILEALQHSGIANGVDPQIDWISSEELENRKPEEVAARLEHCDAILVPGGFGPRGMSGMVVAAGYARTRQIPFLGIGLGMQMAVVEIARSVAGIHDADTDEAERPCSDIFYFAGLTDLPQDGMSHIPFSEHPMRRGAWPCVIQPGTLLHNIYQTEQIVERHHHRRELNPAWQGQLARTGLIFSGTSPDGLLIEAVEWPNHPFFVGVIYHPEFISRPTRPHPLFNSFLNAARSFQQGKQAHEQPEEAGQ